MIRLDIAIFASALAYCRPGESRADYLISNLSAERAVMLSPGSDQMWIVETADAYVISIRGTEPPSFKRFEWALDWLRNLFAWGLRTIFGRVHKGFYWGAATLRDALEDWIRNQGDTFDRSKRIHFVGHSAGGAIAQLLAEMFDGGYQVGTTVTFGSPRVFCKFIPMIDHCRVVARGDPVPMVPPACLGYRHRATTVRFIGPKWTLWRSDHATANYQRLVAKTRIDLEEYH